MRPESFVAQEWENIKGFVVGLRELTSSSVEIETSSQFFYLNIDGKNVLITPELAEVQNALVWIRCGLLMGRYSKQPDLPGLEAGPDIPATVIDPGVIFP